MKTSPLVLFFLLVPVALTAQSLNAKLDAGLQKIQDDTQAKHAIIGLYVINSKTGKMLYERNAQVGLAAASSQKVLTGIAALETLTTGYKYQTRLAYRGKIINGALDGDIVLTGSGDPTLGSWRYGITKENVVMAEFKGAVKQAGIQSISGDVVMDASKWESQTIPGGWIWDDIGNYYGAGAAGVNWRENQYDLILKPGRHEGDPASIITTIPELYGVVLKSELTTGSRGSGDQGIIYLAPGSTSGVVRGSVPLGEDPFTISGSFPDPLNQLKHTFRKELLAEGISIGAETNFKTPSVADAETTLAIHSSPSLDSIIYWFLKRSINLYGEALVKTIAREKTGFGSTDSGLAIIKSFWKERGIEMDELQMLDGSGLSPQNRVTVHSLATAMQYVRSKSYFNAFFNGLPELNGLRMKSGSIGGARSFTGYVNGKQGDFTFAIIINGYNGSSLSIVRKLYTLLDILK